MFARRTAALVLLALLALAASVHAADGPGNSEGFAYVIREGDTLSRVAQRFGITLDALLAHNEGLDPDRIRPGQTVRIVNGLRRVVHTVERGESLSAIAARYETSIEDLLRWNRGISRHRIQAGRDLVVYTAVPESRSLSIGTPSRGRLVHGRQLPLHHPAFLVRRPDRAYGTDETVRWLTEAYEALHARDPDTPRVEIRDLSLEGGGPITRHHSHESGRDADGAYFQRRCGELCRFRRVSPDQLDAERQWALFSYWLERDVVEMIFVDHSLAARIYAVARESGVSRRKLSRWFQYPRKPHQRQGIIRHYPRHADHYHVRFICPESDPDCR